MRKKVNELRYFINFKCQNNSFPTADFEDKERANDQEIELSEDNVKDFDKC